MALQSCSLPARRFKAGFTNQHLSPSIKAHMMELIDAQSSLPNSVYAIIAGPGLSLASRTSVLMR
jgi:hypothetical protein